MIALESLEEMFSNIASGAKWDMSQPMLWGYFFTDESVELQVRNSVSYQAGPPRSSYDR